MKIITHWLASFSLFLALPASAQLVILQYHHIATDTPPVTSISPAGFEEHMQLLEQENMVVVDLKDALAKIRAGVALPEKAVAITFDDAYVSIYDNAFPRLQARNWPFTVFVNTRAVDERHNVVMSWDQLRDMQNHGGLIANHTQSHPYLIEPPQNTQLADWLEMEINGAEQRLQKELGTSHKILAYPYGEYNVAVRDWLQQQGYIALGQQSGPVGASSHFQALPRYPAAGVYANPKTLRTKLYTKAFPISAEQSVEPVLSTDNNPPALTLTFSSTDLYARQIQCYSGAEGAIPTKVQQTGQGIQIDTAARGPIKAGRDRYNCTAPSKNSPGWYYWYSQAWINPAVKNR
ncbi:polysaccharide deacetylase family protein [Oceanospirillaceae bacterium ASx5O]|nr:polysaccharide deacetylase family protein [Oceanospirillaceae bacterium ASx5O]